MSDLAILLVSIFAFLALIVWWSLRFARHVLDEPTSPAHRIQRGIVERLKTIERMHQQRLRMIERGYGDEANVLANNINVLQGEVRQLQKEQNHDAS